MIGHYVGADSELSIQFELPFKIDMKGDAEDA